MSTRLMSIADLEMIPDEIYPFLILTDKLTSWISFQIKQHSHGYYNHSMWMPRRGVVASQGWTYKERPIDDFLRGDYRVKLWFNPNWGASDKARLKQRIAERLQAPKKTLRYDWRGIVGQFFGFRKFNSDKKHYCSEETAAVLATTEAFGIEHPTPADLNQWCKEHEQMTVYGVYDPDMD